MIPAIRLSFHRITLLLAAVVLVVLLLQTGCGTRTKRTESPSAGTQKQRKASQSVALLRSAIGRFRDLPFSVDTVLQPPTVVLDSRSSTNGQDILATVEPSPGEANSGLNRLEVRTKNAGFLRQQIKAGDIVKCYVLPDRESRDRLRETGEVNTAMITYEPLELPVAQVLGTDTLLLAKDLRIPISIAQDLFGDLDRTTLLALESQGAINEDGLSLLPQAFESLNAVSWPFKIEVWRTQDDRMLSIGVSLSKYGNRGEPAFGWEPSGDQGELEQLTQRINQWTRGREQSDDWSPADLLSTIDSKRRNDEKVSEHLSDDALRRKTFASHEGRLIQEAIWLRDISRWAAGDKFDPLARGEKLFDWVVRNVYLSDDPLMALNRPWQTLLAARGGAAQRAWVFAALCRQQRIPAAVIEIPQEQGGPWYWCGLLSEGELYLFDPQLGLPIPSSDNQAEGEADDVPRVPTLAGVRKDPQLLRLLDLPDAPYPVSSEQLAELQLYVVAEPMALSWRAGELQTQLRGRDSLVLQVDADADAKKLEDLGLGEVRLWRQPFEYYLRRSNLGPKARAGLAIEFRHFAWRPVLWQARTLHFRGLYETEEEAKQKAAREGDALYEAVNDHRLAAQRYAHRSVRPSDKRLSSVTIDKRKIYERAKADATYFLGLLKFEQGGHKASQQWLENAVLSTDRASQLAGGVRYNLARALAAQGNKAAAAELLEADDSPQQHGNRLLARMLRDDAQ